MCDDCQNITNVWQWTPAPLLSTQTFYPHETKARSNEAIEYFIGDFHQGAAQPKL